MERKARILRFWFAILGVALLGLWEPALWFGVAPLFFFPGCACCGCDVCSPAYSSRIQVDVSGVVDGTCPSCENWNGTFFLDLITGSCQWRDLDPIDPGCIFPVGDGTIAITFSAFQSGNYFSRIILSHCHLGPNLNEERFLYDHGASAPDCSAFSALTHPFEVSHGGICLGLTSGAMCDGSGATVQATAVA